MGHGHMHLSSIFASEHYEFLVIMQYVIKYNHVSKRVLSAYQIFFQFQFNLYHIMYKTGI